MILNDIQISYALVVIKTTPKVETNISVIFGLLLSLMIHINNYYYYYLIYQ